MSEPQQDVFDAKAAGWDSNPSILQATSAAAEALKSTGLLHPGCNVLEVGCGTGLLAEKLADSLALLVGVDPSQGMIDVFKARAAARRDGKLRPLRGELASPSSLAAAAAADGGGAVPERYHLALSCLTFHHLLDIPGTLRLLRHHLEPGGSIAVLDFAKEPGSMRFHDPAHCHGVRHPGGFTPEELEAYLRGAGFEEARARVVATLQKPAHGGNGEMLDFGLLLATARAP